MTNTADGPAAKMGAVKPTMVEFNFCRSQPLCIRNVCILAHVDHGKTTLADLLLATNRIISNRMAGQVRYLDDRPDERERGITMKSTAVSLLHVFHDEVLDIPRKILLNVIDTPGHIDFSSDVSAAVRVCEGAIIMVDVIEGVCVQTRDSIRQAFEEHTSMILVINKIDRLILELAQQPAEMCKTIVKIIENANVIVAELYQCGFDHNKADIENTGLLFHPPSGNVIFASAIDGWAFTTQQMCHLIAEKVEGETYLTLNERIWDFRYTLDVHGHLRMAESLPYERNLFIQVCLNPIQHVYQVVVVRQEPRKIPNILEKLKIEPTKDIVSPIDARAQLKAILSAFKPLANTLMSELLNRVPSPALMTKSKVDYLLDRKFHEEDLIMNGFVEELAPHFGQISLDSPCILYVSKMFVMDKKQLMHNASNPVMPGARPKLLPDFESLRIKDDSDEPPRKPEPTVQEIIAQLSDEITVIALARVYSGSLHVGQEMYLLPQGYNPSKGEAPQVVTIKELYMFFGKELHLVECVPAGNICGIGCLENHVTRTATLSTSLDGVPLIERPVQEPLVRYVIEPLETKDLPILRNALKFLKLNDPCIEVMVQKTGEMVIVTAGDVHLDKCIEDIRTRFGKIEVQVSRPMVALRETIDDFLSFRTFDFSTSYFKINLTCRPYAQHIANFIVKNYDMLMFVEKHETLSAMDVFARYDPKIRDRPAKKSFKNQNTARAVALLEEELSKQLASDEKLGFIPKTYTVWSVSNNRECPNLLINATTDYYVNNIFTQLDLSDKRSIFHHSIVNAFKSFCEYGPVCKEPISNCVFFINHMSMLDELPRHGEVTLSDLPDEESHMSRSLKSMFDKLDIRIMEPLYRTEIEVTTAILDIILFLTVLTVLMIFGIKVRRSWRLAPNKILSNPDKNWKVFSVVHKKEGRVVFSVGMDSEEKKYLVTALIPVVESDGFAMDIRRATSGQATPHMQFSHYEVIPENPLHLRKPKDNESDEEYQTRVKHFLRASRLVTEVRKRKGLSVKEEVVKSGEGQKTQKQK